MVAGRRATAQDLKPQPQRIVEDGRQLQSKGKGFGAFGGYRRDPDDLRRVRKRNPYVEGADGA